MSKIVNKARFVYGKSAHIIRTEGPVSLVGRSTRFAYRKVVSPTHKTDNHYKDILFINGCALPHPARYRVDHQVEQLRSHGLTTDTVFYEQLQMEMLDRYRGFVFFRCPVTETVSQFIEQAKQRNKTCFFDVDDLVIDQKYTDLIEYVQTMPKDEKAQYNDGVDRMRTTLEMCDYAITTTERLQKELKHYAKEVFINRNVVSDEMIGRSADALRQVQQEGKDNNRVVIGYFSGSITHNEDFEMVLPSLIKLLKKHKNLYIKIAGILDVPIDLQPFQNRIIPVQFMDWRLMPKEVATCDINIAPLTDNIFNEAKSENKWTEAALVKVVTAASNVGAFKKVIQHDVNGILVDDAAGWFEALDKLIKDKDKRESLGQAAYKVVRQHHTTFSTGFAISQFIQAKLARNIAFVLPSTDISGGVNVVLKHAEILQRNGWDVTLIDAVDKSFFKKVSKKYNYRTEIPGHSVVAKHNTEIEANFDTMVATLWSTLKDVQQYPNAKHKLYFVQSMETDFFIPGMTEPRISANATYCDNSGVQYITMSLWCQKWLKEEFRKDSKYASNGIDLQNYSVRKRDFDASKIKILIEGDSSSEYKNTDEAFRIVEKLDPARYEISYLSYRKEPKEWYRVDHFYNRIASDKVGEVYASCDILIKTSLLESFSYPPLEMMATGGVSVVAPNEGNIEYLRDKENCLFYRQGDIADGVAKVELLIKDAKLRNRLIKGGRETAERYQWESIEQSIVNLYK